MWIRLGLVLLVIFIAVRLTRQSKIEWSIITLIIGLVLTLYIILIISGGIYHWQKESEDIPSQERVMSFIQDINPNLHQKMNNIHKEILLAHHKIQQLYDLRETFPNQKQLIDQKIKQWEILKNQLNQVSNNIEQEIEKAYVAYQIDEIQDKDKFTLISQALLKEANAILVNAEATKSTLEEQLYE